MKPISCILVLVFLVLSCAESKKDTNITEEPIMYESSEMAILMRGMYEYNKATKTRIINKDSLIPFPEEFSTIHSAVLTQQEQRTKEFDSLSTEFLRAQKNTFSSNQDSTTYHFNRSINLCITCHETRCTGPLPKIKKLLIN